MKNNIILILALFLLFVNLSYSQRPSEIKNSQVKGIYLTVEGFKNNVFSCSITSFLYIYAYKTIKTEYKQYGPTRRAKETPVTYYYFSSGDHKRVYSLTTDNLCKFLSLESDIKVAIKQKFINDEMLYSTNLETGRFALNEFLLESYRKK